MKHVSSSWGAAIALAVAAAAPTWAQAEGKTVYRCPGNPVLYTDSLSAKEAQAKGCRTLEGAPITIVQAVKPRPGSANASGAARPGEGKVDPNDQRARDSDARRILEAELKREEDNLAALQKDYNNGEPERLGDERNYQKYLDRVADMKAAIARKESDIAAIKREISKLPQ
ncbi:MAG TPA: hypothetical protein VJ608_06310 [Albitalea sp.]|nr:hypothetical protein [Albitalea sp.]HJW11599.1 hypothetical protein [Albitalea sp.]